VTDYSLTSQNSASCIDYNIVLNCGVPLLAGHFLAYTECANGYSLVKLYSPFVIDCWKTGCKSCEAFNPTFDELAKDLKGQAVFGKLCIDKNRETKAKYHISGYPTLLVFKNGALVYSRVGNSPKSTLEDLIQSKLGLAN